MLHVCSKSVPYKSVEARVKKRDWEKDGSRETGRAEWGRIGNKREVGKSI